MEKLKSGDLNMNVIHSKKWMSPFLLGFAAALTSPALAQQSSITVNISGVRAQKGNIVVCLWKQQDKDFPICSDTASFQHITVKVTASTVTATFQNVPYGEYAISAFHDENQDGKLNRGFMGRPKEGIALSNMDPSKGDRGRPSFERSKFTVNGAKTLNISLQYF
jgi:uncharacterized protein (DUF2141 family)